jgi:hypothetical protein
MRVIRIGVRSLHNEEWFAFLTDFRKQALAAGVEKLRIKELFALFDPLYDKADRLVIVLQKSVYTPDIEISDKKRDELFRGFYGIVKGSQKQPDEAKQKSALRLYNLLKRFQRPVIYGNYMEESAALYSLLQELKGNYADDIALLSLNDWVTAISNAEQDFLDIRAKRTQESIDKPGEDLRVVRSQIDTIYTAITDVLDAQLLACGLGGKTVLDIYDLDEPNEEQNAEQSTGNAVYHFVAAWNETVKKYRNLLAQRAGSRAKGNASDDAES